MWMPADDPGLSADILLSLSLSLSPHLGSFLAQWNSETLAFENSVLGVNGV